MQQIKEHILIKVINTLVVCALLAPPIAKVMHIFANHEHVICISYDSEHLHELNVDCDLHKFNTVAKYLANNQYQDKVFKTYEDRDLFSNYFLLKDHRQLSFSLRAPPMTLI